MKAEDPVYDDFDDQIDHPLRISNTGLDLVKRFITFKDKINSFEQKKLAELSF